MKKFLLPLVLVIIIALILMIYYNNNSKDKQIQNNINHSQEFVSGSVQDTLKTESPGIVIKDNGDMEISFNNSLSVETNESFPEELDECKQSIEFYKCILTHNLDGTGFDSLTISDNSKITERLDYINENIASISEPLKDIRNSLATEIEESNVNTNTEILYSKSNCKSEFCDLVVSDVKVSLIERYYSRGLITSSKTCKKFNGKVFQDYCLRLLGED